MNQLDRIEAKLDQLLSTTLQVELLTRTEAFEFLKIDSSTLWAWTKTGKITAYSIVNRTYYKKNEIIQALKPVKQ